MDIVDTIQLELEDEDEAVISLTTLSHTWEEIVNTLKQLLNHPEFTLMHSDTQFTVTETEKSFKIKKADKTAFLFKSYYTRELLTNYIDYIQDFVVDHKSFIRGIIIKVRIKR